MVSLIVLMSDVCRRPVFFLFLRVVSGTWAGFYCVIFESKLEALIWLLNWTKIRFKEGVKTAGNRPCTEICARALWL